MFYKSRLKEINYFTFKAKIQTLIKYQLLTFIGSIQAKNA